MKINHLLQFARLQSYTSFNQASQDLFISHQGLSKMVVSMEKELNKTLVNRCNEGITLTENGQYLCQISAEIAQILATLENTLLSSVQQLKGEGVIFMDHFTHAKFFTKIAPYLQKQYPDLSLQVTIMENLHCSMSQWPDSYEFFLQTMTSMPNVIGLFTFPMTTGHQLSMYPAMTVYPLKSSELLLGCASNLSCAEFLPKENNLFTPILMVNERDFALTNDFIVQLQQYFDVIPVKSQLQCISALSSAHTYTIELADDIAFFPTTVQFATCTPPLLLQTYGLFEDRSDNFGQRLCTIMESLLVL